jgi:hypothetical protein
LRDSRIDIGLFRLAPYKRLDLLASICPRRESDQSRHEEVFNMVLPDTHSMPVSV